MERGQVLVRLDTSEEQAQLAAARAEAELARLALSRNERLMRSGAAAEEARDTARAQYDAAMAAVQERGFTDLIPTYVYTGTEYGPWISVEQAVIRLESRLPETKIHDLLVLGSPGFWQALNGRFVTELISRYGFYVPCLGCHLYLHSVRIPLSRLLGGVPIISGERESHNGRIKINQIPEALESYETIAKEFDTELIMPLRNISDGDRIRDLLGFEWKEGGDQLSCVLSGNYIGLNGDICIKGRQVRQYLEEFACPTTRKIVGTYIEGRTPNHLEIAAELIGP